MQPHVFLPDESESVANANFPTVLTSESIQISDLTISPPGPLINTDHFIISFNSHHTLMPSIKVRYVFDYSKAIWTVSVVIYLMLILAFVFSPVILNLSSYK